MGIVGSSFISDTRGIDTVPLKMIFYLTITGIVVILMAVSWSNMSPVYSGAKDSKQINDASLEIRSIQNGYARNLHELNSPEGSMCELEFSLDDVSYLAFGVDPDPDMNGNFSDTQWIPENNTIICQYDNGVRDRYRISGETISFLKGSQDDNGKWSVDEKYEKNGKTGVLIEGPMEGVFVFELVLDDKKCTMSHF